MTENKVIELLKNNYPKTCKVVGGRLNGGFDDHECDVGIAIDLAINALEEVQQYRAIGTIEECRAAMERQNPIATIAEKEDTGTIASEIDAQPTSYDVDKVVEQLEKKIQTHERCIEYEKKNGTITEEFQQRKAVEVLNEAIEIVKGGGVDAKTNS